MSFFIKGEENHNQQVISRGQFIKNLEDCYKLEFVAVKRLEVRFSKLWKECVLRGINMLEDHPKEEEYINCNGHLYRSIRCIDLEDMTKKLSKLNTTILQRIGQLDSMQKQLKDIRRSCLGI